MIKYNNTNNASTTLTAWISASSTTLIVENGDILPTAPFLLTLEHFDNEKVTVREIVKCIAKVGTILTIQRGAWTCVQDDSATPKVQNNTPHSFSVWDVASIYWTSEQVQDIQNEIEKKLNIDDFQAWTYVYGATSTWTDAYSITIPWTLTSYSVGQVFRFMADTENTWNATLNVNGIWEKEILKNHDQHLQSGDIEAGQIVEVAYDGTNFQMDSQIASVISLDDISSLSYNDTTCYAWEEIHENDLIVTNGNSFNPDRADESTDVWGQTVNKYAIGFIGNGESTDTFSIKTSVIEWFEPDSVTINIESDDNWKPSWTALATSSSLDVFKSNTSISHLIDVSSSQTIYDSIQRFYFSNLWENEWNISYDKTTWIITVSGETYNYTLDISGVTWYVASMDLCNISPSDKYLYFNLSDSLYQLYLPNYFSTEWAEITQITAELSSSVNKQKRWAFDRTWHFFAINCADVNNDYKRWILYTETPFDLTNYTVVYNETSYRALWFAFMEYLGNSFVAFTWYYSSWHAYKWRIIKLNPDWTIEQSAQFIQSYYSWSNNDNIRCDIREKENIIYWKQSGSSDYYAKKLWLERDYNYNLAKTFTVDSPVSTARWTQYRLTITPVVTWSIVDSVKIHDKEWEYFSTCIVKDTDISHDWSTVANKTPYIDSSCILARYARKEKEWDSFSSVCGGFANGDFTELENVQYTFKWLKTGFTWLKSDTAYYSTWDWGIATDWAWTYVWKASNDTSLLVNIDASKSRKNETIKETVNVSDETTHTISVISKSNQHIRAYWRGIITVRKGTNNTSKNIIYISSSTETSGNAEVFEWEKLFINVARFSSSYWWNVTITFF